MLNKKAAYRCSKCGEDLLKYEEAGLPIDGGVCSLCLAKTNLDALSEEDRKEVIEEAESAGNKWLDALNS